MAMMRRGGLAMAPLPDPADRQTGPIDRRLSLAAGEKRAAFVRQVAAALAAGETSVLRAIAVAQRSYLSAPPVAS